MAEFLCFSISMEATPASHLLSLSSSPTSFSPLPRNSVRVSNLKGRNRFRNLLSKPNPDLDLVSSNEWHDGSIIFHFGHVREIVGEGVETEKSKVSTSVSDEVASTEAISTEEILGKHHQDQILIEEALNSLAEKAESNNVGDGVPDDGKTEPVHGDHDISKELSHAKALDVECDTIGFAASLDTSADSKAAVDPNSDGSPLNDTLNQGSNIIIKNQFDASTTVSDLGISLLDKKVNEEKDIIDEIQVDASAVVSSSDGAQLDHSTSEGDNIIVESQVDTVKEENSAISEVELNSSTMVSTLDDSQLNATSNEQNRVINEAKFNTSTLSYLSALQLDESIKKESTVGPSLNGSQLDDSANEEDGIIGDAQFDTSTIDSSSNSSKLDVTTNRENNIIGKTRLGTSTTASNVGGPQLGHTTNEGDVSIKETKFATSTIASNADGSQFDDKVNQESTVASITNWNQPSSILANSDVDFDTKSFIEEKSEIKTSVEGINSVSLEPAVPSHPIPESKEKNIQMDVTDHPIATGKTVEEDLTERTLEEGGFKHEVHCADSAKTIQASMEESGYAETDTNREEILTTELCVSSGGALLPHPSKALTGGEDAYFIGHKWLGVADGACQWSIEGVNVVLYAQELMENSKEIMSTSKSLTDPVDLIVRSAARTQAPGLSTVLVAYFNGQALHVANIGDTGFMVIRNGIILKRSTPMVHEFHFPMQIEMGDDPSLIVESYKTELDEGDIIVFATDGMFDNLYEQEIVSMIQKSIQEGLKPQDIAKILATRAHEVGSLASARSPFADAAHAAGYVGYTGGKLDDVTVIVSLLERNSSPALECDRPLHLVSSSR